MAAKQIIFFKKNNADATNPNIVATASQGSAFASYVTLRNPAVGWMTTGSVDSDNTTLTLNTTDARTLTDILLVNHNFKSFTIKYWNGSSFVDFSPAIGPTNCTDSTSRFSVASVSTSQVQITILGTQVANADKFLFQFILTNLIGQLNGWPKITNPIQDKNKRINLMLSGKQYIAENIGAFSCDLVVDNWSNDADLTVIESIYNSSDGVLVWLSGGDQTQFSSLRQGYRLVDIFLMKPTNNYQPAWVEGIYKSGMAITLSLSEVTR